MVFFSRDRSKPGHEGECVMVADCRYVHSRVIPTAGFLVILEFMLQHLAGAYCFGSRDAFKRFWKFSYAKANEEVYSLITHMGIYTPTRLIQGGTDSVHAFQSGMMEVFTDLVYEKVLNWIDDILAFHKTFGNDIVTLRQVFERLLMTNVKLNPTRTDYVPEKSHSVLAEYREKSHLVQQ